jgi:hypothetical protein
MKNIILLAMLFVMFVGVVYGAFVATGGDEPDMKGKIVGVCVINEENSTDSNSLLIQGVVVKDNQEGNISVRITNETQIFLKEGNKLNNISFANIKSGQSVEVKFTGPIMQSYPPQATGSEVIITG